MPRQITQQQIERRLRKLKPLMGLTEWHHTIVMHAEPSDEEKDLPYEEQAALEVDPNPTYIRFKLHVYPKFNMRVVESDKNFDLYLIHELVHVHLSEYDKLLDELLANSDTHFREKMVERTTERLARCVMRAMGHEV